MEVRKAQLAERVVAVVRHRGPPDTVDVTRRPLYRHMILHELVGGPSILRFLDPPDGDRIVDALVVAQTGFAGDEEAEVEHLAAGTYGVAFYEGPVAGLDAARREFESWARTHNAVGPVLQVHLMDPMDGTTEQEFQVLLSPSLT